MYDWKYRPTELSWKKEYGNVDIFSKLILENIYLRHGGILIRTEKKSS